MLTLHCVFALLSRTKKSGSTLRCPTWFIRRRFNSNRLEIRIISKMQSSRLHRWIIIPLKWRAWTINRTTWGRIIWWINRWTTQTRWPLINLSMVWQCNRVRRCTIICCLTQWMEAWRAHRQLNSFTWISNIHIIWTWLKTNTCRRETTWVQ